MSSPQLSQGAGYGVLVGGGLAFAFGMVMITAALRRYHHEAVASSENFATAGRTVKTGMISAATVSSWTWAATLLQSTTEVYMYGISGAIYYAAGATVQIILFATLALELKSKAPMAHTYLEIIRERYGTAAHIIYMGFALATNILVTTMLLTGGASVVNYLTGMNQVAACFLLPLGVVIYTLFGGIKATFITDYAHTLVIIALLFVFMFKAYTGNISELYDTLTELAKSSPVDGNAEGSFLTMRSQSGGIFFVINLAGNFGTVFLDNGYWNKAIAASPKAALPGYFFGGLSWFVIPFGCATTMGLACRAAEARGIIPPLSSVDVTAGLALPNAAVGLLGASGAACTLVLLFMAITSASSAELVAVSSIGTYDIYKTYINPKASNSQLIWATHLSVIAFGLAMSCLSTGLYYAGIGMGYLYLLMGVIISAAVLPVALTLLWSWQNKLAVCVTPILGQACGLIAWLVTCKVKYGEINVTTSGSNIPMLAGNVVSLCSPLVFIPVLTLLRPQRYDFERLRQLDSVRLSPETAGQVQVVNPVSQKTLKIARWLCVSITIAFLVIWPMPMYGSGYVFSLPFFRGWIVVAFIWLFFTLWMVGIYPIIESRKSIYTVLQGVYWDLTGKSYKLKQTASENSSVTKESL